MNNSIARFILALVCATAVTHGARAEASPWPADTQQATASEAGESAFTPLFSDNPFDALATTTPGSDGLNPATGESITHRSLLETGGGVMVRANGNSENFAPLTGGIWLFLGGIWIIGTLVHHRQVIRKN